MTDTSSDPNPEGAGYTQIILPTEMVIDMGRKLMAQPQVEFTQEQKNELLSAIMRAIG